MDAEKLRVAPGLERIVRHCLEKRPADRFQSARDLMFASGRCPTRPCAGNTRPPVAQELVEDSRRDRARSAAVALVGYWGFARADRGARGVFIAVPGEVSHLAISPDGKWLAFVSPGETGGARRSTCSGSAPRSAPLSAVTAASYPFWSPDDASWRSSQGKLRKAAIAGGAPQNLATEAPGREEEWGSKGVILFSREAGGGIWRVNADGTGAAPVTEKLLTATNPRIAGRLPPRWRAFPDVRREFQQSATNDRRDLSRFALEIPEDSPGDGASSAAFADGRLYYVDADGAWLRPGRVAGGKVTGAPQVIAVKWRVRPRLTMRRSRFRKTPRWSTAPTASTNHSQLTWFDNAGKEMGRVGPVSVMANPALSPDGKRVAFDSNDFKANNVDVWILDLVHGSGSRFTFDPAEEVTPVWSRDGATIAYRTVGSSRPTFN